MAGDKLISDSQYYSLGGSTTITLDVVIGNTQVGGSVLQCNNVAIPPNAGTQNSFTIRNAAALQLVKVVTTATDINPNTLVIPVTFILNGGASPKNFPYTATVDHTNSQAIFSIDFMLLL